MKRLIPMMALALLVTVPALATDFVTFEPVADCDGFAVDLSIHYATYLDAVTLEYVVTAVDVDGVEVASIAETTVLECAVSTCEFTVDGIFEPALEGGPFTVAGTFTLTDVWSTPSQAFSIEVICGEPPSGWCPRTPGYWKNHPENWPVATLTVGGVELTQAQALEIFATPVRGDATVILAKHLMAAMLNEAMGADDEVGGTVNDANAFLELVPVGSRPRGADKQEALGYKNILADWNETECDEGDDEEKSAAVESASWSSIKGIFN